VGSAFMEEDECAVLLVFLRGEHGQQPNPHYSSRESNSPTKVPGWVQKKKRGVLTCLEATKRARQAKRNPEFPKAESKAFSARGED